MNETDATAFLLLLCMYVAILIADWETGVLVFGFVLCFVVLAVLVGILVFNSGLTLE